MMSTQFSLRFNFLSKRVINVDDVKIKYPTTEKVNVNYEVNDKFHFALNIFFLIRSIQTNYSL